MSPDITNASLFANKTRFPAFTAAKVGNSPAAPTIAAITTSTSACSEIAINPASSAKTSTFWIFFCLKIACSSSTLVNGTTAILG